MRSSAPSGQHSSDSDEELRFADMSVLELLTELKDSQETVVDLAYAALMFNSQSIADEVKKMEGVIDDLKYAVRYKLMLQARTREDARQMSGILEVVNAADKISNAASDMTELLRFPAEKRPYINRILGESDEKYRLVRISDKSDMAGKTIGEELAVEGQTACRIIAVKNRHGWTFDPEGDFKLRFGDEVVARGSMESLDRFVEIAGGRMPYEFPEIIPEAEAEAEAEEDVREEEEIAEEMRGEEEQ